MYEVRASVASWPVRLRWVGMAAWLAELIQLQAKRAIGQGGKGEGYYRRPETDAQPALCTQANSGAQFRTHSWRWECEIIRVDKESARRNFRLTDK